MKEILLTPELTQEIAEIFKDLQQEYDKVADQVPLTCQGCPDSNFGSFFISNFSDHNYIWILPQDVPQAHGES